MTTQKMKLLITYFVILLFNIIHAYRILYLFPFTTKSHMFVFEPLIEELAKRNHHITIVSPYTFSLHQQQNIREIIINIEDDNSKNMSTGRFSSYGNHILFQFISFKYVVKPGCEAYLKNFEVKELLKQGKQFDVVIVSAIFNECALATAPLLGKNIILHCSSAFLPWFNFHDSQLQLPSVVPVVMTPFVSKMNFLQRLDNGILFLAVRLLMEYNFVAAIQAVITEHLLQNPSVSEGFESIDLVFTNADPVITSPRPAIPTIIDLGGMHCRKAKPLSKEFEDFVESSGDYGFILFSLGSISQSKDLPVETIKSLLDGFSRLEQRVIWKYEKDLENVPKNVKISKWLPQKDLLGHAKIRLFITHGGMLSLQESVYNGVPVVAVPLFSDQPGNVARVEEIGIGVKLALSNISGDSMYDAINKVLGDKRYAENLKRYSAIFHDFIENQVEKAAYWVEYVIRHKGT
uniref:UDP-glucuronosyltransferase n=1 Tax=Strigamia maritima TaxID=126957 RepID=T1ILT2_STRMM